MATRKKAPFGRVHLEHAHVAEDVAVHVNRLEVEGETLIEIREWIVSTETYGRGLTLPVETFNTLISSIAHGESL